VVDIINDLDLPGLAIRTRGRGDDLSVNALNQFHKGLRYFSFEDVKVSSGLFNPENVLSIT
jgi:hypothetical protein